MISLITYLSNYVCLIEIMILVPWLCSIRIFSVAAVLCIFIVLPVNLFGQGMEQRTAESQMDIFTIRNVQEGSRGYDYIELLFLTPLILTYIFFSLFFPLRLWAHFFALYVISISAYVLLYIVRIPIHFIYYFSCTNFLIHMLYSNFA